MRASESLTVTEVAALARLEERRVRKEVEHGVLDRHDPLRFDFRELVYFFALNALGIQFGVDERKSLHRKIDSALAEHRPPARIEVSPVLELRLDRVARDAKTRLDSFRAWKDRLVVRPEVLGGEPAFPKSRLAVRHVGGMLLRGASPQEVLEDYPYIDEQDLEFARVFAQAYPRMGRPRAG